MKHIKLFEAWSAKFNRTLQGASAIAKSTNKGFGKAEKEVRDYAEKQISKEEFSLELENGDKLIITHDTNFLLNPISEFERLNPGKIINAQNKNANMFFFIPGIVWFLLKITFFLFVYLWVRATLPRYRYDQLMQLGWKVLIPVTIVWIVVTATLVMLKAPIWFNH